MYKSYTGCRTTDVEFKCGFTQTEDHPRTTSHFDHCPILFLLVLNASNSLTGMRFKNKTRIHKLILENLRSK